MLEEESRPQAAIDHATGSTWIRGYAQYF